MSTDRVTVTLPAELRLAGQAEAEEAGVSFSSVVSDALAEHLRGRAVDLWLAEFEADHGVFSEEELKGIAAEADVPYVPPVSAKPSR